MLFWDINSTEVIRKEKEMKQKRKEAGKVVIKKTKQKKERSV